MLLQLIAGTRGRRLTNVDDIFVFPFPSRRRNPANVNMYTPLNSLYRYASPDVDSNVLYDKIFNWGGEREAKFRICLLLQRLLNYRQPLVPCE